MPEGSLLVYAVHSDGEAKKMATGTVKWFSEHKGYGFISAEPNQNVFVHHSAIEGNGFRTLHEGEVVEFDIKQSDRGKEERHPRRLGNGRSTGMKLRMRMMTAMGMRMRSMTRRSVAMGLSLPSDGIAHP